MFCVVSRVVRRAEVVEPSGQMHVPTDQALNVAVADTEDGRKGGLLQQPLL